MYMPHLTFNLSEQDIKLYSLTQHRGCRHITTIITNIISSSPSSDHVPLYKWCHYLHRRKEVIFYLCLSVCAQDYSKSYERILTKSFGLVRRDPMNKQLDRVRTEHWKCFPWLSMCLPSITLKSEKTALGACRLASCICELPRDNSLHDIDACARSFHGICILDLLLPLYFTAATYQYTHLEAKQGSCRQRDLITERPFHNIYCNNTQEVQ